MKFEDVNKINRVNDIRIDIIRHTGHIIDKDTSRSIKIYKNVNLIIPKIQHLVFGTFAKDRPYLLQRSGLESASKEVVLGPMTIENANKELVKLQKASGKFEFGVKPYFGTLRSSYGYRKKIGIQSQDGRAVSRIDYDPVKGAHFNFIDCSDKRHPVKVCIRIKDFGYEQYKRYIDSMNKGYEMHRIARIPKFGRVEIIFNTILKEFKVNKNKSKIFKDVHTEETKKIK